MFWNLVRYEFKNVNKWYLALYAAVLVLSALIGIQTQGFKNLPYQESQATMLLFLATVFGGLMLTLGISTIFLIIKRFKGSVYDRQGYLTLTLPVSEHHIITAKLIGAFIWSLISTAVLALSAVIILALTAPEWIPLSYVITFVETHLPQIFLTGISFLLNTISGILCTTWLFPLDSFSMNTVQHSLLQSTLVSKSSLDLLNFSSILVLISMSIHW
ncbi:ABC transporter ATP-binding protein [Streptococcus pneumoniae]|nr:ABC transporter ATP-binding protein [Streptococcus pneumoniae]